MKLNEEEIEKRAKEIIRFRRKLFIVKFIEKSEKSIAQECKEFGLVRTTFYNWKRKYKLEGEDGLKRKKPIAYHHPNKTSQEIIDKILELRKE
jgi:transposase-like protein